ncbi:hypothetical protein BG53_15545 [Paenibacillus darwinianus]|uniref:2'-5' RNA ligase n=1 Tax=Paenibacillus darwinianus TaxID=1380763 RepID=A0A9W5W7E3_9BACL|nr:hypothetical protein [Paenibacillus darwinianus]EXX89495.1 hypothetical protein BG53_15545 [Paenibacillus darwinianus]EXX91203.1 hypothetical protein CH50_14100 [Paenibacillus darwinianus]EXX92532.1 hypothetical protein BG52_10705 [Paenibacillus darwinianus]
MNNSIRLFTGIALPEPIRSELRSRLPEWRRKLVFERWPEAEKRPYHPHLTIARKYKGTDRWDASMMDDGFTPLSIMVHETVLFQSSLGRSSMYEIIHRSPLG